MTEPFLGEIKMTAFDWPPKGWAHCNGQSLPINQNQALFSLLGTQFGGNGQTTFALPDFRGRVPLSNPDQMGQRGGEEAHTLTQAEMPAHNHVVLADDVAASSNAPFTNARLANSTPQNLYGPSSNLIAMDPGAVTNTGGSQPHDNMQPYLTIAFCVALQGVFPSRNF